MPHEMNDAASAVDDFLRMTEEEVDALVQDRLTVHSHTATDVVLFGLWLEYEDAFPLPGDKSRAQRLVQVRTASHAWLSRAVQRGQKGLQKLVCHSEALTQMINVILDSDAARITRAQFAKQA